MKLIKDLLIDSGQYNNEMSKKFSAFNYLTAWSIDPTRSFTYLLTVYDSSGSSGPCGVKALSKNTFTEKK